jgi:hypothetical protein
MLFNLSSTVYKKILFERITRRYVLLRCFPPAASMFRLLFSVVLTDIAVMLLSLLLYAPLVCIFPRCWLSWECHLLLSYYYVVTCRGDYRKCFRLDIVFINQLQVVTTNNYITIADFHTLQIITR